VPLPSWLTTPAGASTSRRTIGRFLAGRYRARVAFTIYIAALAILWLAIVLRLQNSFALLSSAIGSIGFAVAFLLPFICCCVVFVGTWRSLRRAKYGHGALRANATELGQLLMLVTAFLTAFWSIFEVPTSFRAIDNARELPFLDSPWSVRADGHRLRIAGPIYPGLLAAVEKALAGNPAIRIVVLDSPGGDAVEGMRVGDLVKGKHLATGVNRDCESACTYIFAAGTERILLPPGRLGFHGARTSFWEFSVGNWGEEFLVSYGIDRAFAHKALGIAPASMWFPTPAELLAAHVITSTTVPPGIKATQ